MFWVGTRLQLPKLQSYVPQDSVTLGNFSVLGPCIILLVLLVSLQTIKKSFQWLVFCLTKRPKHCKIWQTLYRISTKITKCDRHLSFQLDLGCDQCLNVLWIDNKISNWLYLIFLVKIFTQKTFFNCQLCSTLFLFFLGYAGSKVVPQPAGWQHHHHCTWLPWTVHWADAAVRTGIKKLGESLLHEKNRER